MDPVQPTAGCTGSAVPLLPIERTYSLHPMFINAKKRQATALGIARSPGVVVQRL